MNRSFALCLLSLLIAGTCVAQAILPAESGVGEVSFANTGAEAAQPAFLRGLALLHDFEYSPAADSFRETQKIDPAFVMAYWGEAMTYTHPVWYQQDLPAARAVLQRLGSSTAERAAKAKSDRERQYLQTVEVLYGDGSKNDRDLAYADAMAALHQRYPDDVDATAFYAVALLGTSHNGRDTATYMRAAALLEDVFPSHQHHPGVLHYLIHSYDDPVHAPLGMRAARLYGAVAPDADHALHMTSHIFVAMGMWDEVIDANVRAIAIVNARRAAAGRSAAACGHYQGWLHYALLQKHRTEEAGKMLAACRVDAFDPTYKNGPMDTGERRLVEYVGMVTHQTILGGAAAVSPPVKLSRAAFTLAYAEALDAYRRGDAVALRDAAARLPALAKEATEEMDHSMMSNPNREGRRAIVMQQVDAMQMALAGRREEAVDALRKTAALETAMPFEFGPPFIEKPTSELLGDQLMVMKRPAEAAEAYRAALARTPGRTAAVDGLRAAVLAH
jgi:tetratricopeptide (TPR) repeat protein